MITIYCPNPGCGQSLQVDQQFVGKKVKCAHCSHVFQVAMLNSPDAPGTEGIFNEATITAPGPHPGLSMGPPGGVSATADWNVFESETIAGPLPSGHQFPIPATGPAATPPMPDAPFPASPFGFSPQVSTEPDAQWLGSTPASSHSGPPPLPPRRKAVGSGLSIGPLLVCIVSIAVTAGSLTGIVSILRPTTDEPTPSTPSGPAERWAAVAIESSGARLLVLELTPTGESYQFSLIDNEQSGIDFSRSGGGGLYPESVLNELQTAVKKFADFAREKGVPNENLLVVANSGVVKKFDKDPASMQAAKKLLSDTVLKAVNLPLTHLSSEEEAEYGALGCIPPDERLSAISLDIGSSNVKIGYNASKRVFEAAEFPFGTKKFAQEVKTTSSSIPDFAREAASLRDKVLRKPLDELLQSKPAIKGRSKYHLMGGASWAVAVIARPDDIGTIRVPIKPEDVDGYNELIAKCNDFEAVKEQVFSRMRKPEQRDRVSKELQSIGDRLDMKFLVSAGQMLKVFSDACGWKSGADVKFFANGLYAWPLGFILTHSKYEK